MIPQKVDAILNSVQQLRPIPSNVTRILKELEDEKTSAGMISEYVGLDQALAALVLQMANSVLLGFGRTCTSLNEAVMRIGMNRLKSLLLASNAVGPLNQRLMGYRLGAGELWNHSLATAMAAEWLARALNYSNPEEAYVSGLLHDIGKLLLDQFVLTDYKQIVQYVEQYQMPLWLVEEKLIGMDHARVGGLIAERWDFPVVLVDAIRCHHCPSLARTNPALPAIVNLANYYVSRGQVVDQGLFSKDLHLETFNILNLNPESVVSYGRKLANGIGIGVAEA